MKQTRFAHWELSRCWPEPTIQSVLAGRFDSKLALRFSFENYVSRSHLAGLWIAGRRIRLEDELIPLHPHQESSSFTSAHLWAANAARGPHQKTATIANRTQLSRIHRLASDCRRSAEEFPPPCSR